MSARLSFPANCQTTAMGIMPFRDIARALDLVLSLDIPFWPQLPNVSFFEDMYVQTSQNFPGIAVDVANRKLTFNTVRFGDEVVAYSERMNDSATFTLSPEYSAVYHRFTEHDLAGFTAIRGQMTGPVSFGFRVVDENMRPIIYNDEVRGLLYDFIARKVNTQYHALRAQNVNAFVWLDEPGLGWIFSGLSGYSDTVARQDYANFWGEVECIHSLHLCANVNLPYLLSLGVDLLSFDAYQIHLMPQGYARAVADFIKGGGVISWGIVPTDSESLAEETPEKLADRLTGYWQVISQNTGLPADLIARQSLLAPARCCLKNAGLAGGADDITCVGGILTETTAEEELVTRAFTYLRHLSQILREKFGV